MIAIAGREIGPHLPPYVVCEISCSHNGSIIQAKQMIRAAKMCGADACKLQTYTPAELTTPEHKDLWALYFKAQTPRSWHRELFDYAKVIGITIFSSAFSVDGVKFLHALGAPAIKIASAEAMDKELVEAAHATGLPVIISTGMLDKLLPWRGDVLLHCVAQYPAKIEDANLKAIRTLQRFDRLVGLSDHTSGYETAIAATALGAVLIEKHFKLDDNCIDAAYSLNPKQFEAMCVAVRAIWKGMGDGVIRPTGQPRQR